MLPVCVWSEKESPLVDVVWVLVTHQRPLVVETAETVRLGDGGWTAGADVNSRAQVLRTELAGRPGANSIYNSRKTQKLNTSIG